MVRFYADEQFPYEVVEHLRNFGHDVLTVQEAGNANLKIPDDRVLEFAAINRRGYWYRVIKARKSYGVRV
jgi:hypothetical protein